MIHHIRNKIYHIEVLPPKQDSEKGREGWLRWMIPGIAYFSVVDLIYRTFETTFAITSWNAELMIPISLPKS